MEQPDTKTAIDGARATAPASTWMAVAVPAVLLAGIGLRLYGLGLHPLWFDEAITWHISSSSNVVDALTSPGQHSEPPLIHILVHPVRVLTGNPALLRLVPALFGCLALVVWWGILKRWLSQTGTLVGMALLSFSAFHLYYSQELRAYSVVFALGLLLLGVYLEWLRQGRLRVWHWVAMAILEALIVYAHYLAALLPLALAVAVFVIPEYRRSLRPWLLAQALAVLLFLPWLVEVVRCVSIVHEASFVKDYNLLRDLAAPFVVLPLGKTIIPNRAHSTFVLEQAAILLPGLVMVVLMIVGSVTMFRNKRRKQLFVLACCVIVPVLLLNLYSVLVYVNYNYIYVRYLMFVYPPCLLIALDYVDATRSSWRKRLALAGISVWIAVNAWGIGNYYWSDEYRKDSDFAAAVRLLEREAVPGELVGCSAIRVAYPLRCHVAESPELRGNSVELLESFSEFPVFRANLTNRASWHLDRVFEGRPESFWFVMYASWRSRREPGWGEMRDRWNGRIDRFVAQGKYVIAGRFSVRGLDFVHFVRKRD
ncbi:MAG: glycosyltransferase family 39 protein [Planctomycetota bacterium]|nr:glycosyltransferase family 39 protein [Planctomycetota bacterium]